MITLQINGVPVRLNWTTFPDTARGASISGALPTNPVDATIFARPDFKKGVNEMLFDIGMVVNILRNINNRIYIKLLMPYIPYARQDRNMVGHDAFTLKVFAAMLNSYNLDSVVVVDPHSDVSTGLINNVKIITQADVIGTNPIAEVLGRKNYALISPDAGALKKVHKVAEVLNIFTIGMMSKHRNTETGTLSGFRLDSPVSELIGKDLLIVDDICDGGGTFLGAADELRRVLGNSINVDLWITHGLFTQGTERLFNGGINKVYTTDSVYYGDGAHNLDVFSCFGIAAARNYVRD